MSNRQIPIEILKFTEEYSNTLHDLDISLCQDSYTTLFATELIRTGKKLDDLTVEELKVAKKTALTAFENQQKAARTQCQNCPMRHRHGYGETA